MIYIYPLLEIDNHQLLVKADLEHDIGPFAVRKPRKSRFSGATRKMVQSLTLLWA